MLGVTGAAVATPPRLVRPAAAVRLGIAAKAEVEVGALRRHLPGLAVAAVAVTRRLPLMAVAVAVASGYLAQAAMARLAPPVRRVVRLGLAGLMGPHPAAITAAKVARMAVAVAVAMTIMAQQALMGALVPSGLFGAADAASHRLIRGMFNVDKS